MIGDILALVMCIDISLRRTLYVYVLEVVKAIASLNPK